MELDKSPKARAGIMKKELEAKKKNLSYFKRKVLELEYEIRLDLEEIKELET